MISTGLGLPAFADRPSVADLIASLQPSVVNISVVRYTKKGVTQGNIAGQTSIEASRHQSSGFFVDSSGVVLTSRHVVEDADEIMVILQDTTKLRASLVATVAQNDLALLKVNPGRTVPTVRFGDSDRMRPGDPVFLIGNPFGLGSTVTAGIISALNRNTTESEAGSFLQIDAALNPGNSGGPVFDQDGEVIGVSTALVTSGSATGSVGLGLAIPGNDARFIIDRLLRDGRVRLGWIGIHVQPVTADIADSVGLPAPAGAIVTQIDDGSAAARALGDGDIILRVAGDSVAGPESLSRKIASSTIGSVATFGIWREGSERTVPVTIVEMPGSDGGTQSPGSAPHDRSLPDRADLGLIMGSLTPGARAKLGMPSQQTGAIVEDVVPGSAAADRGITAGSAIVNVQRMPIGSPAEVMLRFHEAQQEKRASVLVLVQSRQGRQWIVLPLPRTGTTR